MLLSAVSVLVVAQSSSEIPEGLMNSPVLSLTHYTSDRYHTVPTPDILCLAHRTVVKINNFRVNIGLRNTKDVLKRKWS